jgi:hypothetical protein
MFYSNCFNIDTTAAAAAVDAHGVDAVDNAG